MVDMQRLPLCQRRMGLQGNNHALGRLRWRVRQQPVAAIELFFFSITRNVQRDTLPGMCLFRGLILRMETTNTHRFVDARQPQAVPHFHFTAQRRTRNDQSCAFHGKCAVNG
ncbi:hypothetical protein D3C78_640950 [compost metagenome]